MKFYDCATAPSPRLVRMFIAEKGIADRIETVPVDLAGLEHMQDAFRQINPFLTVPVLELDDGTRLLSTAGCWRYLEEAFPEPALMGETPTEKAMIADLTWRIEMDGFLAVGEALRNAAKGLANRALTGPYDYAQIPELAERGRQRVARFYQTLDDILAGNEYIASEFFSVADIMAFVSVEFAQRAKLDMPDTLEHAHRWLATVKARPSASV